MSVLPSSFSANKLGYKKYLNNGGILDYSSFRVWERRTPIEICAEKIDRLHSAMLYAYDQAIYYKSIEDQAMYELNMYTLDVRSKHLSQAHQELDALYN
jgi:hypothetical protein